MPDWDFGGSVPCRMATVTRETGRRLLRPLTAALLFAVTLALLATPASAQRSRGNFLVYQATDCTGLIERANDPTVTVPFSMGGRNYPANIDLQLFATDHPNGDVSGPFTVTTDAQGRFCERVNQARPTQWKINLIEPGGLFTDSKVITVLPTAPPETTTTAAPGQTTTTVAGQTTTAAATTTAVPGQSTTTVAATTSVPPTEDLGFEVEPVPVPPEVILPATGSDTNELTAIAVALLATGMIAYFTVRRRRAL